MFPEKRANGRRPFPYGASLRIQDRWINCRVIDLSGSGIRIQLSEPLKLSQLVDVRLAETATWAAQLRWQWRLEAGFEFLE